jgi:DNA-binding transcriptional regulator YhcF (GntR family)
MGIAINDKSSIPKYLQLVIIIEKMITNKELNQGDLLPSVSVLMKEYGVSRDTVFKAYQELKLRKVVDSMPNKGYFVSKAKKHVLLILDTFKAYKEVLYSSFINNVKKTVQVDVVFHHYDFKLFESILKDRTKDYAKFIIMSFDHSKMDKTLALIPKEKLLVIDWKIHANDYNSVLYQDFGQAFYDCLTEVKDRIKKYKKFVFLYPNYTYHPYESVTYFDQFCIDNSIKTQIVTDMTDFQIEKHCAYVSVSDRALFKLIGQVDRAGFELGKDIGLISYNETPAKKYVKEGLTVISTNFDELGSMAATFSNKNIKIQHQVPTKLILRKSI